MGKGLWSNEDLTVNASDYELAVQRVNDRDLDP
jgi:hypothetical protein